MANKQIGQLTEAASVQSNDLFVLEQNAVAKKLTGQTLENWLLDIVDGHGGITSVVKTGTSGLVDTYTITYADGSTTTFDITNGADGEDGADGDDGADGTTFTPSVSAAGVISWTNDGGKPNPAPVNIKGEQGENWYVYIRWASQQPTQDSDVGVVPDAWMGVYAGTSETAPTAYTDYQWYNVKGTTGDEAELTSGTITYQISVSGTTAPSGTWTAEIPTVPQGYYLWTRTVLTFNSGDPVIYYSVAYNGYDGQGSPATTTPAQDTTTGNVGSSDAYARADHSHPLPTADDIVCDDSASVQDHLDAEKAYESIYVEFNFSSSSVTYSDSRITSASRVVSCTFGNPKNVTSDVTWTTANGSVTISGTISTSTTAKLVIQKCNT